MKKSNAASASARVSACQMSCRWPFALACTDFGITLRTLPVSWNQQRCSFVAPKTSRSAFLKPKAPSPIARSGAWVRPRRCKSIRSSRQLWVLSRQLHWLLKSFRHRWSKTLVCERSERVVYVPLSCPTENQILKRDKNLGQNRFSFGTFAAL